MVYDKKIKKCAVPIKLKASNLKDNGILQYDMVNDKSSKDNEGKIKTILPSTILTILKNI